MDTNRGKGLIIIVRVVLLGMIPTHRLNLEGFQGVDRCPWRDFDNLLRTPSHITITITGIQSVYRTLTSCKREDFQCDSGTLPTREQTGKETRTLVTKHKTDYVRWKRGEFKRCTIITKMALRWQRDPSFVELPSIPRRSSEQHWRLERPGDAFFGSLTDRDRKKDTDGKIMFSLEYSVTRRHTGPEGQFTARVPTPASQPYSYSVTRRQTGPKEQFTAGFPTPASQPYSYSVTRRQTGPKGQFTARVPTPASQPYSYSVTRRQTGHKGQFTARAPTAPPHAQFCALGDKSGPPPVKVYEVGFGALFLVKSPWKKGKPALYLPPQSTQAGLATALNTEGAPATPTVIPCSRLYLSIHPNIPTLVVSDVPLLGTLQSYSYSVTRRQAGHKGQFTARVPTPASQPYSYSVTRRQAGHKGQFTARVPTPASQPYSYSVTRRQTGHKGQFTARVPTPASQPYSYSVTRRQTGPKGQFTARVPTPASQPYSYSVTRRQTGHKGQFTARVPTPASQPYSYSVTRRQTGPKGQFTARVPTPASQPYSYSVTRRQTGHKGQFTARVPTPASQPYSYSVTRRQAGHKGQFTTLQTVSDDSCTNFQSK
ncbi:hypothetical protein J6590_028220 [Homalodisca vitripennis]|nr:hypothetical protein J6590_028220 [Homalodisca vitripennis]